MTAAGCSVVPEPKERVRESDERAAGLPPAPLDRLRQPVVGAMGEVVAVDREEQTRSSEDLAQRPSIAEADTVATVAHREWLNKCNRGRRLVIVESPAKAKTIAGYLGKDYMVESSIGHIRDLPHSAAEVPAALEAGAVGAARRERRPRLRAALRRRSEEEDGRHRPAGEAQVGRRAAARDGRRPRGRGDRLASRPGAEPEGAGAPDGVPRDHEARDRAGARGDARHRRRPRRRAGDAAHPRPPLRLRGLARPLAQGDEGPLGRPGAVGRDAARRRARARADRVPRRRVLGHRRARSHPGARSTRGSRRSTASKVAQGRDFARNGDAHDRRRRPARRGRRARASPPRSTAPRSPSARSSASRTRAARPRRS